LGQSLVENEGWLVDQTEGDEEDAKEGNTNRSAFSLKIWNNQNLKNVEEEEDSTREP
jgi:hypothetical protein